MSNRLDAPPRPGSRINDREDVKQSVSSNHQQPPPNSAHDASKHSPPLAQSQPQYHQRDAEYHPLPGAQSNNVADNYSPSASRLAGVASILNQPPTDESPHGRRRKASELESNASAPSLPPLTSVTQGHQPPYGETGTPPGMPSGSEQSRRILTPRSPSGNRPTSLNQMVGPPNPSQPLYTSSPRPRGFTESTASGGASALPTPSTAQRHSYGFSGSIPSSEVARRVGATHGAGPTSDNTSPSTNSYSPYSQGDLTSPAAPFAPTQHGMPTLASTYSTGPPGGGRMTSDPRSGGPLDRQRPVGIPISSAGGQNVYQMMTLETTSGTVQLPVDVQAASRVADEKRRRNAGASARFRQRRKEKEREASTSIARLEQRLKDMSEDMEFYKRERDYFASVVMQTPGYERHFPRPASPVRRRRSSSLLGRSSSSYVTPHEDASRSPEEGRRTKRRTSGMTLPPPMSGLPPQSAVSTPGGLFHPSYNSAYGTPFAQHPQGQQQHMPASPGAKNTYAPSIEGHHQSHQHQNPPSGPPQMMQAPPNTGPWNPYAQDRRPPGPGGPPASR